MASTYSALKIELIGTGEQSGTWGATTDVNLGDAALGAAITGSADVNFSTAADVTLSLIDSNAAQSARNLRLNLTESSTGIGYVGSVILGSGCQIKKLYLVNNTTTAAKTIKNTTGTGITVPAGKSMFVFNDATNVVDAVSALTSLSVSGTVTANSFTGAGTGLTGTAASLTAGTATTATTANALNTGNAYTATAFSDSLGNLRNIPINSKTTGYTLLATDNGQCISITTGGITVPNSVFSAGQTVAIYNNSGSSQTITQGAGLLLYLGGTFISGNKTLSGTGLATILFISSSVAVITGAGLS
jgi:hypothetical protein